MFSFYRWETWGIQRLRSCSKSHSYQVAELRFEPRMKGSRLCILPSYCMLLAGTAVGRLIWPVTKSLSLCKVSCPEQDLAWGLGLTSGGAIQLSHGRGHNGPWRSTPSTLFPLVPSIFSSCWGFAKVVTLSRVGKEDQCPHQLHRCKASLASWDEQNLEHEWGDLAPSPGSPRFEMRQYSLCIPDFPSLSQGIRCVLMWESPS